MYILRYIHLENNIDKTGHIVIMWHRESEAYILFVINNVVNCRLARFVLTDPKNLV